MGADRALVLAPCLALAPPPWALLLEVFRDFMAHLTGHSSGLEIHLRCGTGNHGGWQGEMAEPGGERPMIGG